MQINQQAQLKLSMRLTKQDEYTEYSARKLYRDFLNILQNERYFGLAKVFSEALHKCSEDVDDNKPISIELTSMNWFNLAFIDASITIEFGATSFSDFNVQEILVDEELLDESSIDLIVQDKLELAGFDVIKFDATYNLESEQDIIDRINEYDIHKLFDLLNGSIYRNTVERSVKAF